MKNRIVILNVSEESVLQGNRFFVSPADFLRMTNIRLMPIVAALRGMTPR